MAVSTDGFYRIASIFSRVEISENCLSAVRLMILHAMGAKPLYLTCAFVIEEGFPMEKLEEIAAAMEKTAKEAGVHNRVR